MLSLSVFFNFPHRSGFPDGFSGLGEIERIHLKILEKIGGNLVKLREIPLIRGHLTTLT
jgi:hypothetical protein